MPRIRTIKPEFFWDVKIGRLSPYARLTFIGLWCLADDYGTLNLHPMVIKGQLFPFDQDVDIEACLKELEAQKLILRYGPEKIYTFIPNFKKHQKINRPSEQRQAPPPEDFGIDVEAWLNSEPTHGALSEDSVSTHGALSEPSGTETETETEMEQDIKGAPTANAVGVVIGAHAPTTVSAASEKPPEETKAQETEKPAKSEPKIPSCPYQEILRLYNETLPEHPQVRVLNEARKRLVKTRWREVLTDRQIAGVFGFSPNGKPLSREEGLAWFKRFFEYVRESKFLHGQVPPSRGRDRPFIASFEWLMGPKNFAKVIEGFYHQRAGPLSQLSHAGRKTAMAAMELIHEMQEEQNGMD